MGEEDNLGMELFGLDVDFEDASAEEEIQDEENTEEEQHSEDTNDTADDNVDETTEESEEEDSEIVAEEEENTEEEDTESDDDDSNNSPNLYKSLTNILAEEGVLTEVTKDVKNVDELVEAIKGEIKKQEFSDLNDLQREAIEAYRAGIPVERFNRQKEVEQRLDNINEEVIKADPALRRQLIYQEFKLNGFSDEKAERFTKRSFDTDGDIEDAIGALTTLKGDIRQKFLQEQEDIKEGEKERTLQEEKRQEKIKKQILETDEVFKGYKLNEGLKKKIYSEIYNPTGTNPDTGKKENELMKYQREQPEDFMHKLYYFWTATDGFKDLNYFKNKERTNGVKELEQALRESTHVSGGGSPSFVDDKNSYSFDIGEELVLD